MCAAFACGKIFELLHVISHIQRIDECSNFEFLYTQRIRFNILNMILKYTVDLQNAHRMLYT